MVGEDGFLYGRIDIVIGDGVHVGGPHNREGKTTVRLSPMTDLMRVWPLCERARAIRYDGLSCLQDELSTLQDTREFAVYALFCLRATAPHLTIKLQNFLFSFLLSTSSCQCLTDLYKTQSVEALIDMVETTNGKLPEGLDDEIFVWDANMFDTDDRISWVAVQDTEFNNASDAATLIAKMLTQDGIITLRGAFLSGILKTRNMASSRRVEKTVTPRPHRLEEGLLFDRDLEDCLPLWPACKEVRVGEITKWIRKRVQGFEEVKKFANINWTCVGRLDQKNGDLVYPAFFSSLICDCTKVASVGEKILWLLVKPLPGLVVWTLIYGSLDQAIRVVGIGVTDSSNLRCFESTPNLSQDIQGLDAIVRRSHADLFAGEKGDYGTLNLLEAHTHCLRAKRDPENDFITLSSQIRSIGLPKLDIGGTMDSPQDFPVFGSYPLIHSSDDDS